MLAYLDRTTLGSSDRSSLSCAPPTRRCCEHQLLVMSPVLHVLMVRVLTSGLVWSNYHRVSFIINLPLPLQIMGIRFLMKVCRVVQPGQQDGCYVSFWRFVLPERDTSIHSMNILEGIKHCTLLESK